MNCNNGLIVSYKRSETMKIIIADDYKDMSRKAANYLSAQVILKPGSVIGLATGETPIGTYNQLVNWYKKGDIDFSQTKTVNLDEYKGLEGTHEQSYRFFMNENLFDRINIDKKNTYLPNGMAEDEEAECERYNGIIEKLGGIDMQLLGIGLNGHIGFNEPGAAFEKETHCVDLTESTIEANKRFFASEEDVLNLLKVQKTQIRDFSNREKKCLKRHLQWESSQLCSQSIFYLLPAEPTRLRLLRKLSLDL